VTDPQIALAAFRAHLAGLLAQIDQGPELRPDQIVPTGESNPGPRWDPAPRWTIRAIDEPELPEQPHVYVTTPHHHAWEESTDFTAIATDEARAVAMALLAAADWADGLSARNVTHLDAVREQR
jgi:hypothetical protein